MGALYISIILHLIIAALCASTYWKAARMEDGPSPFVWSLTSLAVFAGTWLLLNGSWPVVIAAQFALGLIIGIVRALIYLRRTRQ